MKPNFKAIYTDLISAKFPEKLADPIIRQEVNQLNSALDILRLNGLLFSDKKQRNEQLQKSKSYQLSDIKKILKFQIQNKLNDSQTANHFKMSRNTIKKWKDLYSHLL